MIIGKNKEVGKKPKKPESADYPNNKNKTVPKTIKKICNKKRYNEKTESFYIKVAIE